jgi:uncharacterized protein (TIGR02996 family)
MPETAMSTEEGFLDALRKDPFDDVARLIYADWLEEQGDARGEYLRLELELSGLADDDLRLAELEQRGRQLRAGIGMDWLCQAGKPFDLWLLGYSRHGKIAVIKAIRELTGVGLAEGKRLSETLPARILSRRTRAEVEEGRDRLGQAAEELNRYLPGEVRVCIRPADAISPEPEHVRPRLPPLSSGPFDISLCSVNPAQRMQVIRALWDVTGKGLRECLEMTQGPLPVVVCQGVSREEAQRIRALFPDPNALSIMKAT